MRIDIETKINKKARFFKRQPTETNAKTPSAECLAMKKVVLVAKLGFGSVSLVFFKRHMQEAVKLDFCLEKNFFHNLNLY